MHECICEYRLFNKKKQHVLDGHGCVTTKREKGKLCQKNMNEHQKFFLSVVRLDSFIE